MNLLFNKKQQAGNERLSKMSPEKYDKASRALGYQDQLKSMQQRPIIKPKSGESDSGSYASYMSDINRLKAGIRAGGDIGKERDVMESMKMEAAKKKRFEDLSGSGAIGKMNYNQYTNRNKELLGLKARGNQIKEYQSAARDYFKSIQR